jgi:hypothetical protein
LLVSDHLQPMLDTRPAHLGRRPPKNELLRLDENSISQMPSRPSLTSWPGTTTCSWPRTAWIWRFIACMSAIAA